MSPQIVLLHALAESQVAWNWVLHFLPQGMKTIAVDLPGFGSAPLVEENDLGEFADRVWSDVEDVTSSPVILAGVAFGAAVGLHMYERRPRQVAGVLSAALGPTVDENNSAYLHRRIPLVESRGIASVVDASLDRSFPPEIRSVDPDRFSRYRAMFLQTNTDGYISASLALAKAGNSVESILRQLDVPTVIIGGRQDTFFSPDTVRTAALDVSMEALVCFEIIRKAGHLPHVQAPERFMRQLVTLSEETSTKSINVSAPVQEKAHS